MGLEVRLELVTAVERSRDASWRYGVALTEDEAAEVDRRIKVQNEVGPIAAFLAANADRSGGCTPNNRATKPVTFARCDLKLWCWKARACWSAPTSSGKTMIGELAAVRAALDRRRAIFLLPMRALVNDKYAAFTSTYGEFGIRTIRATGEIEDDIPDLMRGRYDICLMTNQKFAAMALAMPYLLDQVSVIVLDEAQMIADPNRGVVLEFLLTMLKVRAQGGPVPQVVLLSAVIGAANGLDRWLDAGLLVTTQRPVPLDEGLLRSNGDFRYIDATGVEQTESGMIQPRWGRGSAQDWIIPLVRRLVDGGEQVIVFRSTRGTDALTS